MGPYFEVGAYTISAARINYFKTQRDGTELIVDIHFEGDAARLTGTDAETFRALVRETATIISPQTPEFATGDESVPFEPEARRNEM